MAPLQRAETTGSAQPGGGATARRKRFAAHDELEPADESPLLAEPSAFSPFNDEDILAATEFADRLHATADSDSVERAIEVAEAAAASEDPGLVDHAMRLFLTHNPQARRELSVPAVREVPPAEGDAPPPPPPAAPPPFAPPGGGGGPALRAAPPAAAAPEAAPAPPAAPPQPIPASRAYPIPNPRTFPADERRLDWYRQDPRASDHHAHWHTVYPSRGESQERQGELFLYMHQQMLARYATERLVAGLDEAVPFAPTLAGGHENYRQPIAEGYGNGLFRPRDADQLFDGVDDSSPQLIADSHEKLRKAVDSGAIEVDGGGTLPLDEAILGAATEPSAAHIVDHEQATLIRYGGMHNRGHRIAAGIGLGGGAMGQFFGALGDPFFYRWHGHIDDLYTSFQETVTSGNDFAEFAPEEVAFAKDPQKPDLGLVLSRDIPGADASGFDFGAWGRQTFGSGETPFGAPATNQLLTRFELQTLKVPWLPAFVLQDMPLLVHEPFTLFLRIQNRATVDKVVTVRVFLAHADLAEERRRWIEIDKFRATLAQGWNLLAQPDALSSVIKRKDLVAPGAAPPGHSDDPQWCDCGWPYGLLVPSGAATADGTRFRLMAAVTDHAKDMANEATTCGSMSFCGAEDGYPDERRMGYPFNLPFEGSIADTIAAQPTMTVRDLTIRCEGPHPGS